LEAADKVQTLLALADFAQRNQRLEIVERALASATVKQPALRSTYIRRLRILETIGPTAAAHQLTEEMLSLWPNDADTRMHEIYLRLLLGAPDASLAEREAEELARKLPPSGASKSTVALARLKAGHPASALEALGGGDINLLPANVSWPVYAAALAANGWTDKARAQAERLTAVKMLPEERALIAPLIAESGKP
jgi:hypothetical protein